MVALAKSALRAALVLPLRAAWGGPAVPMESVEEKIERYATHFRSQIALVERLETGEGRGVHHQILYCAILDAMSKPVFPRSPADNRSRFVRFLEKFGDWADGQRISLVHLERLLSLHPDPAFEDLRLFAKERLAKWRLEHGWIVPLKSDPLEGDVAGLWPKGPEHEKPLGIGLKYLSHLALLWRYRNSLMHEYRPSGGGWDIGESPDPYYHHVTELISAQPRVSRNLWELVYPRPFLHRLCETSLANLAAYLKRNALNPFDSIVFGPYWLSELNWPDA